MMRPSRLQRPASRPRVRAVPERTTRRRPVPPDPAGLGTAEVRPRDPPLPATAGLPEVDPAGAPTERGTMQGMAAEVK